MGVTHLAAICRTLIKAGKDGRHTRGRHRVGNTAGSARFRGDARNDRRGGAGPARFAPLLCWSSARSSSDGASCPGTSRFPCSGSGSWSRGRWTRQCGSRRGWKPLGAEVLLAPTVQILPVADPGPLDDAIGRLAEFDWLVFTSGNGVRFFLERLLSQGADLRAFGHLKLAAIGTATAQALARYHLRADLVPDSYRSEALAEALSTRAAGRRILLARADRGRALLREELEKVADVHQVAVYRNADAEALPGPVARRIESGTVDWITLTSSAIATRLHALLPASRPRARSADRSGWPA